MVLVELFLQKVKVLILLGFFLCSFYLRLSQSNRPERGGGGPGCHGDEPRRVEGAAGDQSLQVGAEPPQGGQRGALQGQGDPPVQAARGQYICMDSVAPSGGRCAHVSLPAHIEGRGLGCLMLFLFLCGYS